MRFVCDHDVDAAVTTQLQKLGHEAWTVGQAALATAGDDDLTVYAMRRSAVLITHDKEFSERRRRNVIGHHIFLRCNEWDAADILTALLDDIRPVLEHHQDAWVRVSHDGMDLSFAWT